MPSLWLPPGAGDEMLEHQKAAAAETIVGDFGRRLKLIDQRLGICFVDTDDPNGALRTGFWHIYRRNSDQTLTWWEISDPQGNFMEPNDKVLERFREHDADHNPAVRSPDYFRRKQEASRRKQERRKEQAREESAEHLKELADFEFRTQVPVTPDGRGQLRTRGRRR